MRTTGPDGVTREPRSTRLPVRRPWLLALLVGATVVAARVGSTAGTGGPATLIRLGFGRQQVWQPLQGAADLQRCTYPISLDCVRKVMEQHGASADAFEFYRLTGWFLADLQDTGGPVMSATVVNPWRANENVQPALVGGFPVVVYPEDVQLAVENDAGFKTLKAEFPQLIFWKSGAPLETYAVTAAGERFVFRYRLLDGSHAGPTRGWARIEFDFATDGTLQRAKLLNVVRQ